MVAGGWNHCYHWYLLEGGGGEVEIPQEPPELHGWRVVLGQAGEVVVGAGQELPQLVGDGDGQRRHWKYRAQLGCLSVRRLPIHDNCHHASYRG